MSQKYVIGNWKLNPATQAEAIALSLEMTDKLLSLQDNQQAVCKVGVAPCFLHTDSVREFVDLSVAVGVQDITHKTAQTGAFTGDVSACQVADVGATFTLIGHSERRQYHAEDNDILAQKIRHAFDAGLSVIFCIGETKEEYEKDETFAVLKNQLEMLAPFAKEIPSVKDVPTDKLPKLLIAYEPVWAIGTGLTPTFDEVQSVHNFIGEQLSTLEISSPILYGGSVNDKNAPDFAKSDVIDGALVGGASLKAESFVAIIKAFS